MLAVEIVDMCVSECCDSYLVVDLAQLIDQEALCL